MSKEYKQVIELFASGKVDAQNIVLKLAQEHPSIFLKLVGVATSKVPEWLIRVYNLNKTNRILAIKLIRENTRMGLYDSKQVSDHILNSNSGDSTVIDEKVSQFTNQLPMFNELTWRQVVQLLKEQA